MSHASIPTEYKGCRYRSRLEATWAAFMEDLGWPCQYEPVDLAGYIPDFIITWPWAPLLLEVKPALSFAALSQHTGKIEASGWEHDALIVGTSPVLDAIPTTGFTRIGLLSQRDHFANEAGAGWCWGPGLVHQCDACKSLSIHHQDEAWNCYACGAYEGNGLLLPVGAEELSGWWNKALSTTQWKGGPR